MKTDTDAANQTASELSQTQRTALMAATQHGEIWSPYTAPSSTLDALERRELIKITIKPDVFAPVMSRKAVPTALGFLVAAAIQRGDAAPFVKWTWTFDRIARTLNAAKPVAVARLFEQSEHYMATLVHLAACHRENFAEGFASWTKSGDHELAADMAPDSPKYLDGIAQATLASTMDVGSEIKPAQRRFAEKWDNALKAARVVEMLKPEAFDAAAHPIRVLSPPATIGGKPLNFEHDPSLADCPCDGCASAELEAAQNAPEPTDEPKPEPAADLDKVAEAREIILAASELIHRAHGASMKLATMYQRGECARRSELDRLIDGDAERSSWRGRANKWLDENAAQSPEKAAADSDGPKGVQGDAPTVPASWRDGDTLLEVDLPAGAVRAMKMDVDAERVYGVSVSDAEPGRVKMIGTPDKLRGVKISAEAYLGTPAGHEHRWIVRALSDRIGQALMWNSSADRAVALAKAAQDGRDAKEGRR